MGLHGHGSTFDWFAERQDWDWLFSEFQIILKFLTHWILLREALLLFEVTKILWLSAVIDLFKDFFSFILASYHVFFQDFMEKLPSI